MKLVGRFRLLAGLSLVAASLLLACSSGPSAAQNAPTADPASAASGLRMVSRAAYDGAYRAGSWLPVTVELQNDGPDRLVELCARTVNSATYAVRLDLPNSGRKSVVLYVYIPNIAQRLDVQLLVDGVMLERQTLRLQPYSGDTQLVGLLSGAGLTRQVVAPLVDEPRLRTVRLTPLDLPEQAAGLALFDNLVIEDLTTTLSPAQATALEEWVARGGQLIIGGGAGMAATLDGLPARLRIARVTAIKNVPASRLYGPAAPAGQLSLALLQPLPAAHDRPPPYVRPIGTLSGQDGTQLAYEQTFGRGAITVVALPLSGAAFAGWPRQALFWEELLWRPNMLPAGFAPNTFNLDGLLEGNLAATLTSLPVLRFPSLSLLGGLLLAYVVLVGPVTYLVLRHFDRLALGWLAVPLLTLIFAGLSYGLGYAQRGGEVLFNQVTLVESADGLVRRRSLVGIFSPSNRSYTIDVLSSAGAPAPLLRPISVQGPWDGSLGSQNGLFIQQQDRPPLAGARASELEIAQWSLRALLVDTIDRDPEISARVTLEGDLLRGELQNTSDRRLEDVTIIQGDRLVHLGDIEPGEQRGGILRRQLDPGMLASGAPLSYLIYHEQIDAINRAGQGSLPPELQNRIRILDTVFSYGPAPRSTQPLVIAWGQAPGVELRLPDQRADQQASELITFAPRVQLGEGIARLERGWLNQRLEVSQEGLCFGNLGVGVNLVNRPVLAELSLPRDLVGMQIEDLTLLTSADGPWPAGTILELYDWQTHDWVDQPAVGGALTLDQPPRFVGSHGRMRVRFSIEANNVGAGCLYVDATLKGRMP